MRWLYRFRRHASVAEAPERLDPGHDPLRKVERVVARIGQDDTESTTPVEEHRRHPPTLAEFDAASPLSCLAIHSETERVQAPVTGHDIPTVAPGAIPAERGPDLEGTSALKGPPTETIRAHGQLPGEAVLSRPVDEGDGNAHGTCVRVGCWDRWS